MIEKWSKSTGINVKIEFSEGKGEVDAELREVLSNPTTREMFKNHILESLSQEAAKVQFNKLWKALNSAKNDRQYTQAFEGLMKFIHLIPQLDNDILAPLRKAVVQWDFAYEKVEPSMRIKFNPTDVRIDKTIHIPKLVKVVKKETIKITKLITVYDDKHGEIRSVPKKIDLQKSEAIVSNVDIYFPGGKAPFTPTVNKLTPQTYGYNTKGSGGRHFGSKGLGNRR